MTAAEGNLSQKNMIPPKHDCVKCSGFKFSKQKPAQGPTRETQCTVQMSTSNIDDLKLKMKSHFSNIEKLSSVQNEKNQRLETAEISIFTKTPEGNQV